MLNSVGERTPPCGTPAMGARLTNINIPKTINTHNTELQLIKMHIGKRSITVNK